jgi:hypothetical protein
MPARLDQHGLLRHAERFGAAEDVYETAEGMGWDAPRLADFAKALRDQDQARHEDERADGVRFLEPVWSLTHEQKNELIRRLLGEDLSWKLIQELVGVGKSRISAISGRMRPEPSGPSTATRQDDPDSSVRDQTDPLGGLDAAEWLAEATADIEPFEELPVLTREQWEARRPGWHAWVYGDATNPMHA